MLHRFLCIDDNGNGTSVPTTLTATVGCTSNDQFNILRNMFGPFFAEIWIKTLARLSWLCNKYEVLGSPFPVLTLGYANQKLWPFHLCSIYQKDIRVILIFSSNSQQKKGK